MATPADMQHNVIRVDAARPFPRLTRKPHCAARPKFAGSPAKVKSVERNPPGELGGGGKVVGGRAEAEWAAATEAVKVVAVKAEVARAVGGGEGGGDGGGDGGGIGGCGGVPAELGARQGRRRCGGRW